MKKVVNNLNLVVSESFLPPRPPPNPDPPRPRPEKKYIHLKDYWT